ncbi:unknown [Eubacterium sp. CAG:786]|nr:unknown [Eubacterium sp. CAG:786]
MIGVSALTAIGIPPRSREYTSYSDTDLRLIIEEDTPYTGSKTVAFYLTDMAGSGKVVQLAKTTIRDVSGDDDRYKISWISDEEMMIGFQDGDSYRTLQIPIDRTIFPEVTEEAASEE